MDVVVAGSHGLIGSALVARLASRGHRVRRLVRGGATGPDDLGWDPVAGTLAPGALDGADAVVNLAGAGLGDRRWTRAYRDELRSSRLRGTELLARAVAACASPPALLQASAMGYYGDRGETTLPETAARGSGFLADLVVDWEAATGPAREAGARVALLRTSLVLAPHGGALGRLLPLVRAGLGGPLGDGRQYWSWITLDDHVAAVERIAASDVGGPVNLASPDPVPCRDLVRALAAALGRPAVLRVPRTALRVAVGAFADDLLTSARLDPVVLRESGFAYAHPRLDDAVRWVAEGLNGPAARRR